MAAEAQAALDNAQIVVDAGDIVITLLSESGSLSESFTQTWVQVQDGNTPPNPIGPATQSNVEAQEAAQADLNRRGAQTELDRTTTDEEARNRCLG